MQSTENQTPESNQRSPEWFKQREGKSTSSEFHKLMGIKGFGQTGLSYSLKKAVEILEGVSEEEAYESYEMKRGTELEPLAFRKLSEVLAEKFITIEQCDFIELNKDTGGSPDGKASDNSGIEIKCPGLDKLMNLIMFGEDAIDNNYIIQMQHQMWVGGFKQVYFFNYAIHNGREIYHLIIVKRNEEIITKMKERQIEFVSNRDNYIEVIKANRKY